MYALIFCFVLFYFGDVIRRNGGKDLGKTSVQHIFFVLIEAESVCDLPEVCTK